MLAMFFSLGPTAHICRLLVDENGTLTHAYIHSAHRPTHAVQTDTNTHAVQTDTNTHTQTCTAHTKKNTSKYCTHTE